MKAKCIQPKLNEPNESQVHSNQTNWIKWKASAFKQYLLIQIKVIETIEIQLHSNKGNWFKQS